MVLKHPTFLVLILCDSRVHYSPVPLVYPCCSPARIFQGGWHSLSHFILMIAWARLICLFVYTEQSCTSQGACSEHPGIPIPLQEQIAGFQQMEFLPIHGLILWYGQPDRNISKSLQRDSYYGLTLHLLRKKRISKAAFTLRQQGFKIALTLLANRGTSVSWSFRK